MKMSMSRGLLLVVGSTLETLLMVTVSLVISTVFGVALGTFLVLTRPSGVMPNKTLNQILGTIANIGRSIPFVILMVAIIPFTRFVVGTSIGPVAAIVPLSVSAIPFVARLTETAMLSIEPGVIDAVLSMGATWLQLVRYVLIPEALPELVAGAANTAISLTGYSAMAGAVGGGGLGDLAIRYGYQRWEPWILMSSIVVLVVMVQGIQYAGDKVSRMIRRR